MSTTATFGVLFVPFWVAAGLHVALLVALCVMWWRGIPVFRKK